MKVLHLYANHKWTGPADLALQLVRALASDGSPLEVELAVAGFVHRGMEHAVRPRAEQLGIRLREGLALRRHLHLPSLLRDAARLAGWIDAGEFDVLHCHQAGDHLTAAIAQGLAARRVPLVRSTYDAQPPAATPRTRLAFGRTEAVCVAFASVRTAMARSFSLPIERVTYVPPPLGGEVLEPADAAAARSLLRAELGLSTTDLLLGVTARIQRRRRWELLWEALALLGQRWPNLHLAVLGRPDHGVFEEVCQQPLAARGLLPRVHFLGYRAGAAYLGALRAFDVFIFSAPGSDATCRAMREAMASGLPVVAVRAPGLDELVADGEDGLLCAGTAQDLAGRLAVLLGDAKTRSRLGARARAHAAARWTPMVSAGVVRAVYEEVAAGWRGESA